MVKSTTHSIKSNHSTLSRSYKPTTWQASNFNKSAAASRRASMAESMRKAYGEVKKKGLWKAIPTRFVVVFIAALANTLSYIMRTNMSVTIVAMVNHTDSGNNSTKESCIDESGNGTSSQEDLHGEFLWDETLQGHILGAFYYGYILTNINGGQLADMFGPRWLCGMVTLFSSILTLATPVVARWSTAGLIVIRVATGLAQGILTPAIYALLAGWIPRYERGLVLALIQVGGNLGAVFSTIFSGFLCKYGFADGWPSVFYVFGSAGVICFFLWMYNIYNSPAEHPRISEKELCKIRLNVNASLSKTNKTKSVPWLAIMTSMPMWAIAVAKFCGAWGNLMLMSKLPSYLQSMLHITIQNNGYITSAVYVALSVSLTGFGFFSDWIGEKKLISDTLSRKIFETIALGGPALCLVFVPLVPCDLSGLIALLLVAMTIFGFNAGGDKPVVVDIAPDHSGTIYGITNAIASLPGILSPLVVGSLINNFGGRDGWNLVFWSASGVYIFGLVFFLIFGTAQAQSWGVLPPSHSRRATIVSRSRGPSRGPSRGASRGASRLASRRATFVEQAPSRKATIVRKTGASTESQVNSTLGTPRTQRKAQFDDGPSQANDDIFTIDLNKAIKNKLKDRFEREPDDVEDTGFDETEDVEADKYLDGHYEEGDYEIFDEEIEIELDEEEERLERLQYFKERRFSVFPIA